jgi:hypothetical protein
MRSDPEEHRRNLICAVIGAVVGIDWGVAFAVAIEGEGGVIPTPASVAIVLALAIAGAVAGYALANRRLKAGSASRNPASRYR